MIDTEITVLAREYAEEMIKGKPSEELPNCLKNSLLTMNTEYVAEIFQWLTRRFCVVEKSKVKEMYDVATEVSRLPKSVEARGYAISRLQTLESLFPETAKEEEE